MEDVYSAPNETLLPASLETRVRSFERSELERSTFGVEVVEH